jgi:hypothetical protein
MPRRLRAVDFRSPPPEYEFADGRVVQTRYLDAAGFVLLSEYEADEKNVERLAAVLQAIVPDLEMDYIAKRVTFQDVISLIGVGKGHADALLLALKNGVSGGEIPAPSPTPDSATTTPSHASSPA